MKSFDKPEDNCGIVGIYSPNKQATPLTLLAMISLQHRGQEGAGMAISTGDRLKVHKASGFASSIFPPKVLSNLGNSYFALGHTRYSTAGSLDAMQPFISDDFALAHNGNLTNIQELSNEVKHDGTIISDTWLVHQLICQNSSSCWEERMRYCLPRLRGAFSFVGLSHDKLFVIRDPWGFRPLVLGRLPDGGWVAASETCAFEPIDATFIREVMPGEGLIIDEDGLNSFYFDHRGPLSRCIFEYIYIARPDSRIFGQEVHAIRKRCGQQLSREAPVVADLIISIPHSGDSAARGFSDESHIPMEEGVYANPYVGRAFIEPLVRRKSTSKLKYGVISSDISGKRVCAIDDSIVRGDASANFVRLLRDKGAKEVHLRIASPTLKFPCFYGVDFATKEELIGSRYRSTAEIRRAIGADSLAYLSFEGLIEAVTQVKVNLRFPPEKLFASAGFCGACFTGHYPVNVNDTAQKEDRERISETYTTVQPHQAVL